MCAPGIYENDQPVKGLQYMSVAKWNIQFWRQFLAAGEILGIVDYVGVSDVAGLHQGFIEVVSNVHIFLFMK